MKRAIQLAAAVLVVAFAVTAMGAIIPGDYDNYPSVRIALTPHNLNNNTDIDIPGNRICVPCHTPHNARLAGEENILWNHAETTVASFTMYFTAAGQPEGRSKMCLGCHDGVTAVDSYGGLTGTHTISGSAALGSNLSDDHPIGIAYPSNDDFNPPASFEPGIGGAAGSGVRLVDVGGTMQVECTSCHNPHNNGLTTFLRVPKEESYLCLQCHIK